VSVEAISWAFQQFVPHSSAKFVLVAMANHADADMRCWPSSAHLCSQTAQDRKTVQANLARLREWGYLIDTGERRGTTKQVIVYQLNTPKNGPVKAPKIEPEVADNATENGPVEQAQKRNSTENGTGPNFPPKRPVFPAKEAQISPETGPKTGHGTVRNHQGTIKEPVEKREPQGTRLPADWLPSDADIRFCETERPDLRIDAVAAQFRDYWVAQPGTKGRKTDWPATWRNWVRRQSAQPRASPRQAQQANTQRLLDRITGIPSHEQQPHLIDIN
jgi:hypothetical protein